MVNTQKEKERKLALMTRATISKKFSARELTNLFGSTVRKIESELAKKSIPKY
jgi:hypothetical protein